MSRVFIRMTFANQFWNMIKISNIIKFRISLSYNYIYLHNYCPCGFVLLAHRLKSLYKIYTCILIKIACPLISQWLILGSNTNYDKVSYMIYHVHIPAYFLLKSISVAYVPLRKVLIGYAKTETNHQKCCKDLVYFLPLLSKTNITKLEDKTKLFKICVYLEHFKSSWVCSFFSFFFHSVLFNSIYKFCCAGHSNGCSFAQI